MFEITEKEIHVLQKNLMLLRKAGGWTAEEFGDLIGVTKQTIGNLENKKTDMSKTQYIAIRTVLDYEAKNKDILKSVIDKALEGDGIDDVERERLLVFLSGAKTMNMSSAGIIAGLAALGVFIALSKNPTWTAKLFGKKK